MKGEIRNPRSREAQGRRAGFVSQALGTALDAVVIVGVYVALLALFGTIRFLITNHHFKVPQPGGGVNAVLIFVLGVVLFWSAWSGSGRAPGMAVLGLRIVDRSGDTVSSRRAFWRAVLAMLTLGFGVITVLFEPPEPLPLRHGLRHRDHLRLAPEVARFPTKPVGFWVMATQLSHLEALESESIHIFREVAAEFEKPVLLFSGGKDSIVMARLAEKAFWPARIPFPLMHVDTGHNFEEVLDYRDRRVAELGVQLVVASVQASIDTGRVVEETGPRASRNRLQTVTLLDAIQEHGFDAVFGGGRRDEEKARAKERVYSFRDDFGQWDPKNQRPELWNLYNGRHRKGEHIRVFPLSNWTELDIWQYIKEDDIEIPSIYYAHRREVFRRDGMWLAVSPFITVMEGEERVEMTVRYRTVGDASCTGAVESPAATVDDVIMEVAASRITERGATRADDKFTEAAMEDRKREGYF